MSNPRLLIVDCNYPNENNLYGDVFVHSRLKHYQKEFEIKVVGWNKRLVANRKYFYEGIQVEEFNRKEDFLLAIDEFKPAAVGIHFIQWWMVTALVKRLRVPFMIWIHGHEALGWYRRLFLYSSYKDILYFLKYIPLNTLQMYWMNRLIRFSNKEDRVSFIFVSKWMKRITETDTNTHINNYLIVPNPIDVSIFKFSEKDPLLRKRVLLIRSFQDTKYATDIATDAIKKLINRTEFKDLHFTIVGLGRFFKSQTKDLRKYSNVSLVNKFINTQEIYRLHKENGIFLCPTRQDAQGVSMCEAMSSGLIPISSNNTAIPEYVEHLKSGILTDGSDEIAAFILKLYHDEELFSKLSSQASKHIQQKASHTNVVRIEIDLILQQIKCN